MINTPNLHCSDVFKGGMQHSETKKPASTKASTVKMASVNAKKHIVSLSENVLNCVSIACRSISQSIVTTYYFIKHKVLGIKINDKCYLEGVIKKMGPGAAKLLRLDSEFNKDPKFFAQKHSKGCDTNEDWNDFHKISDTLLTLLDNNITTKIPDELAQKVVTKEFGDKYTVSKFLGAGSIASCHEVVAQDGKKYVAKIVPTKTKNKIASNMVFWNLALSLPTSKYKREKKDILHSIRKECDLTTEHEKHSAYRGAMLSLDNKAQFNFGPLFGEQRQVNLTFSVPEIIESKRSSDLIIMEKAKGYTLAELKRDRDLFVNEFSKCLDYKPDVRKPEEARFLSAERHKYKNDRDYFLEEIQKQVQLKWKDMVVNKKIVHGDLNDGNIMIAFNSNNEIDVSILDMGNCFEISEPQIKLVKKLSQSIKSYLVETPEEERTSASTVKEIFRKKTFFGLNKGKILDKISDADAKTVSKIADAIFGYIPNTKLTSNKKESIRRQIFFSLAKVLDDRDFHTSHTFFKNQQKTRKSFDFDLIRVTGSVISQILSSIAKNVETDTVELNRLNRLYKSQNPVVDLELFIPEAERDCSIYVPNTYQVEWRDLL